jgi:hypothetical protein
LGQAMWPSGLDSSASARESGAGEQSWGGGSACCGKMEQGEGAAEASTVPPCCPHATAWNRKKKAGRERERRRELGSAGGRPVAAQGQLGPRR